MPKPPNPPRRRSRPWLAVRQELEPSRRTLLGGLAFILPLLVWSALSYTNLWKPMIQVTEPGDAPRYAVDSQVERGAFETMRAELRAAGQRPPEGFRANPAYLPAPHKVGKALITAFTTAPQRRGDPWLHESLLHSIRIIGWGFLYSVLIGVPLGVMCGTFALFSRLLEPPIDFIRYMPAPAFGALAVAIFGIEDAPKVAIIFVGTVFQMVLVVANTTRQIEPGLLEAAQTLGATRRRLVTRVVIPGILPSLYGDMRILLGWAWTYLIVAELIGAMSGISSFIYLQAKYRNYDNVYAAIILIGIIGLATDQALAWVGRRLFPYLGRPRRARGWFARGPGKPTQPAIELSEKKEGADAIQA